MEDGNSRPEFEKIHSEFDEIHSFAEDSEILLRLLRLIAIRFKNLRVNGPSLPLKFSIDCLYGFI
jgi:hypothetical protein